MNNSDTNNPTVSGLIIPANGVNSNGIYVQCVAIPIPTSAFVLSNETGYFQVQGLLNMSQSSIVTVSYNLSHSEVSWEQPFSLDITEIDPDIYGYTVCTKVNSPTYFIEECNNQTSNSVVIAKYSVTVLVKITANNVVGRSIEVMHLVDPCSYVQTEFNNQAVVSFDDEFTKIVFYKNNTISEITERTEICLHFFNISIYGNKSASIPVFETSQFAVNNLTVECELQRNAKYTAIIKSAAPVNQSTIHHITFQFQEIVEITPATSIVNNSSKSTLTTVAVTTIIQSVTPLNDSNQYSDNQQIPVVIAGAVSGGLGAFLVCIFICSIAIFILAKIKNCHMRNKQKGNEYDVPVFISAIINEPATAQNKAYASVMEMNQNEAYGQVNNNLKTELEQQPHVYEELSPTVS